MITIIGAGPVGNYLAYELARQGNKVRVVEEHQDVGRPVQCTGIVTSEFAKIIKLDESFVVNKVKRAKIFSPNQSFIEVKLKKENIILDRAKLDFFLYEKAKKEGVEYILGKRFNGNEGKKLKIGDNLIETDYLIGADGPMSTVARSNGLYGDRKFVVGSQVRVNGKFESDLVEFYLGVGSFGWVVPESEKIARIGVVAYKNPNKHLQKLLDLTKQDDIIDKQGGFIPLYNPKQVLQKGNVLLIGDAATQVKGSTFGGLVPGLLASKVLVKDIKNYKKNVRKKLHKDLYLNLMIRKIMDRFTEKDYNELLRLFMKDKVKEVIEDTDRDFPSKFLLKLLIKEPRLLKFSKKLLY
ncbi:MAG: NAD(P)/FAD-dependent oxidoreductase [archaeon]